MAVNNSNGRTTEYSLNPASARHNRMNDIERTENVKLNIKDVERSYKEIYESFAKLSKNIENASAKSAKTVSATILTSSMRTFNQLDKMHEAYSNNYVAREAVAQNKIAINTINSQNKVFFELEKMHSDYLNTYIRNEAIAADKVAKIWGRKSNGTAVGTVSFDNSANSFGTNERLISTFEDLEKASSGMLENMEDMSKGLEDTLKEIDRANKNRISNQHQNNIFGKDGTSNNIFNSLNNISDSSKGTEKAVGKNTEMIVNAIFNEVEKIIKYMISSADKFRKEYQAVYREITTRTGIDREQMSEYASEMAKKLREDSSLNKTININNDLLPAMEQVAKEGFLGDEAKVKAYGDAIANKLMPWFESNSEWYRNIYDNLDESSVKQLKGQQLLLRETQSGNRLLQSGVINQLSADIAPAVIGIEYNTGGVGNLNAEYTQLMKSFVDSGMSESEAYAKVKELMSIQKDQYGALTSGDASKVMIASGLVNGKDITSSYFDAAKRIGDLAESTGSDVGYSAVMDILAPGSSLFSDWKMIGMSDYGFGNEEDVRRGIKKQENSSKMEKLYDQLVKNSSEYITSTEQFQNLQDNTMSFWGDKIKGISDQLADLVGGVTSIVSAIAGKRILFGKDGTGGVMKWAKSKFAGKAGKETAEEGVEQLAKQSDEIIEGAEKAVVKNLDDAGKAVAKDSDELGKGLTKIFKNFFKSSGDDIAEGVGKVATKSVAKEGAEEVTKRGIGAMIPGIGIVTEAIFGGMDIAKAVKSGDKEELAGAVGSTILGVLTEGVWLAADVAGFGIPIIGQVLGGVATGAGANWTGDKLGRGAYKAGKGFLENEKVQNTASAVGDFLGKWTGLSYILDGSHATGLNYVPYDGYIAELHEGERVLTAYESQKYTSELVEKNKNMYNTYTSANLDKLNMMRDASQSNYNSDAIVKALREVASDIIKAIKEVGSGTSSTSNLIRPNHTYDETIVNLMSPV